jgi:hypothetical protein
MSTACPYSVKAEEIRSSSVYDQQPKFFSHWDELW